MKILAFETSCDDTAVSIVEDGIKVLANIRNTQTQHEDWGGVVPELAARLHADNWKSVLNQCLTEANLTINDIDYIACTQGPGLQSALLTGTTSASFLSLLYQKPLIPVHHIKGHIFSVFLERKISDIKFPNLVLTVSGGHTQMQYWESILDIKTLGSTLDDATGEAFDKTAKMLGLGYPGGPIISEKAKLGNRKKFQLPRIYLDKESLDFSFSGLKSSIYRLTEAEKESNYYKKNNKFSDEFIQDISASFEFTIAKIFIKKINRVLEKFPEIQQISFVGGVSANTYLNQEIVSFLKNRRNNNQTKLITPKKIKYSTDNAAMIASLAYFLVEENPQIAKIQFIDAQARMKF